MCLNQVDQKWNSCALLVEINHFHGAAAFQTNEDGSDLVISVDKSRLLLNQVLGHRDATFCTRISRMTSTFRTGLCRSSHPDATFCTSLCRSSALGNFLKAEYIGNFYPVGDGRTRFRPVFEDAFESLIMIAAEQTLRFWNPVGT